MLGKRISHSGFFIHDHRKLAECAFYCFSYGVRGEEYNA